VKHDRGLRVNQNQGSDNHVHYLLASGMRPQIRELKHDCDECNQRLLRYLERMNTISEALYLAQQSTECLLTKDPFETWERLLDKNAWDDLDASTAKKQYAELTTVPNVVRIIARPTRQQFVEVIKRVDEYRRCLTGLLDDLSKLESLHTTLRLAVNLKCDRPLETAEARKRRQRNAEFNY
jgi:hypothetical protein